MDNVTITFPDGETIDAELNGNCCITDSKPDFPEDMSLVTVEGEDTHWVFRNAEIIEAYSIDGRYWWAFREIPEAEIAAARMDAQVTYTALVTDTLLED